MPPLVTGSIRTVIASLCAGSHSRRQVNEFVALCHGLATVTLRRKITQALVQSRFQYGDYRDMAYDCIAVLFRQDADGSYVALKTYFSGIDLDSCDDEEVLAHVRRLVVSRVHQELFRIYGELDPTMAKILRNIKNGLRRQGGLTAVQWGGDWVLQATMIEPNDHLPMMEPRQLERELAGGISGGENIPALLAELARCLRRQTEYARAIPLLVVARVLRSLFVRGYMVESAANADDPFTGAETRALITKVCDSVKQEMLPKYTGRKRVPREVVESYFQVFEEILVRRLVEGDEVVPPLYEQLKTVWPELTRVEYYRRHRSVVEYLARITHERVIHRLKSEI